MVPYHIVAELKRLGGDLCPFVVADWKGIHIFHEC